MAGFLSMAETLVNIGNNMNQIDRMRSTGIKKDSKKK
jgi:hypothetical protein